MGGGKDLVGTVLQGTYRIDRLIGEGGMGAVYDAAHLRLVRRFAVKILFPSVSQHPEALARFQREALITSALGHPHILEVIDFNHTPDGAAYIIMELLEGEDLAGRLKRTGRIGLPGVTSILRQASSALHAAHIKGIIHRDLKPQNIFLCRRGKRDDFVKIVDFGISKVLGSQSVVTKTQALMGTPAYMSPEQADEGAAQVDLRTDVYAMGVIVYETLTGRAPFVASSIPSLLYKIVHEEPPLLRHFAPEVPEGVEDVVHRALSKDLSQRFSSMEAFWESFAQAIEQARVEFTEPTEDRQPVWIEELGARRGDPTGPRRPQHVAPPAQPNTRSATIPAAGDRPVVDSAKMTTLTAGAGEAQTATSPGRRSGARVALLAIAGALVLAVAGVFVGIRIATNPPRELPAPRARGPAGTPDARIALAPDLSTERPQAIDARAIVTAKKTTRGLWLTTKPDRASVRFDDKRLGETPLVDVAVPVKEGTLIVSKSGFKRRRIEIEAGYDALRLGHVTLRPRRGIAPGQPKVEEDRSSTSPKKNPSGKPQPRTKKGWIMRPVIE